MKKHVLNILMFFLIPLFALANPDTIERNDKYIIYQIPLCDLTDSEKMKAIDETLERLPEILANILFECEIDSSIISEQRIEELLPIVDYLGNGLDSSIHNLNRWIINENSMINGKKLSALIPTGIIAFIGVKYSLGAKFIGGGGGGAIAIAIVPVQIIKVNILDPYDIQIHLRFRYAIKFMGFGGVGFTFLGAIPKAPQFRFGIGFIFGNIYDPETQFEGNSIGVTASADWLTGALFKYQFLWEHNLHFVLIGLIRTPSLLPKIEIHLSYLYVKNIATAYRDMKNAFTYQEPIELNGYDQYAENAD